MTAAPVAHLVKTEMHRRPGGLRRGRTGPRATYAARCSCGWQGRTRPLYGEASDDASTHRLEVRHG